MTSKNSSGNETKNTSELENKTITFSICPLFLYSYNVSLENTGVVEQKISS
jgi:hypothetical protein